MLRRWTSSRFVSTVCFQHGTIRPERTSIYTAANQSFHSACVARAEHAPLRKQLKDAARESRGKRDIRINERDQIRHDRLAQWELTVGIEIHAQLNTGSKLFSRRCSSYETVATKVDPSQVPALNLLMYRTPQLGPLIWLFLVANLYSNMLCSSLPHALH